MKEEAHSTSWLPFTIGWSLKIVVGGGIMFFAFPPLLVSCFVWLAEGSTSKIREWYPLQKEEDYDPNAPIFIWHSMKKGYVPYLTKIPDENGGFKDYVHYNNIPENVRQQMSAYKAMTAKEYFKQISDAEALRHIMKVAQVDNIGTHVNQGLNEVCDTIEAVVWPLHLLGPAPYEWLSEGWSTANAGIDEIFGT